MRRRRTGAGGGTRSAAVSPLAQSPISPPSLRVMTTVAERGRALPPSGQWLPKLAGLA
jgi:hypothetical protein